MFSTIVLQSGPIKEVGINGDQIDDLLEYVVQTLKELNQPPFNARETSLAITHCEEALHWLAARTAARVQRGVEGTGTP